MKKNIFSVLITALTVINVVLTAVMFFVMLPTFQKTNNLITQVASVLNLELNGDADADPDSNYTIKDMQPITVAFEEDENYNLQPGTDGKAHYAMLSGYVIYLNNKSEDFDDINELLAADQSQITGIVRNVIQSHTSEDGSQDVVEKECLEKIEALLDSKVVVKINLNGYVRQ